MSRSYKKAIIKDENRYKRWHKRQASKKVRRTKHVGNGGNYKRVYPSWDINDYIIDLTDWPVEHRTEFVRNHIKYIYK